MVDTARCGHACERSEVAVFSVLSWRRVCIPNEEGRMLGPGNRYFVVKPGAVY